MAALPEMVLYRLYDIILARFTEPARLTRSAPFGSIRARTGRFGRDLGRAILLTAMLFAGAGAAAAQSPSMMALAGNRPAAASRSIPVGAPNPDRKLSGTVVMALRHRAALERLLDDLQDPASPSYRRWLTPEQFTARFGPAPADFAAVADWLRAQGLDVTTIGSRTIRFSGTVAALQRTFATSIRTFGDGTIYANVNEPMIPVRFANMIAAVRGLDNMLRTTPMTIRPLTGSAPAALPVNLAPPLLLAPNANAAATLPDVIVGLFRAAFGPQDLYTFYDEPAATRSATGSGCIAVVGISDVLPAALSLFSNQFGLPDVQPVKILVDGSNPGVTSTELEPLLDLEWAHAAAPSAPIRYYLADLSIGSLVDAISAAVNANACGTIEISYAFCGEPANFYSGTVDPILAQAAAQGQSVFVPTGDWGAAGLQLSVSAGKCVVGSTRNVSELSADPNVTSVGGSSFAPNYDSNGDDLGYVPESVYNDSGRSVPGATGGGASAIFAKPSYQSGPGVPADGRRDIPDVAMLASPYLPGVYFGNDDRGTAAISCCAGGTSLGGPIWAAIGWLAEQRTGQRLGNINPALYRLAAADQMAAGLRDVTSGNNDYNDVVGYQAGPGYDQTTGWGTVDIGDFLAAFAPTPTPTPTATGAPTETPTPSATPTLIPTATPTATLTPSSTPTPTITLTATPAPSSTSTPTPSALPTPAPTDTPAPADSPTVTPLPPPTAAPTATEAAGGALLFATPIDVQAPPGSVVTVGSFEMQTGAAGAKQIDSVTVATSNPALFATLTLTATIAGNRNSAVAKVISPTASNVFTFNPPLTVPAGAMVEYMLQARIAGPPPPGGG